MPPKKRKILPGPSKDLGESFGRKKDETSMSGESQGDAGGSDATVATNQLKEGDHRIHPLLLPNVFPVVLEHLDSKDVCIFGQVCKTWNKEVKRRYSASLNPMVLTKLVPYLSKESLLHCRLVCLLWNAVILQSNRWNENKASSTQADQLYFEEQEWTSFFRVVNIGSEDLERFSAKFGETAFLPLPLAFTHFIAPNSISLNDETTQDFLNQFGRSIKSLTMHRCKWDLEDLRSVLFENSPNLKYLRIVSGIIPGTQPIGRGKKQVIPEVDIMLLHEDPSDFPVLENMKWIELDMNMLDTKDQPRPYVDQFLTELFESCRNLEVLNFDMSAWYTRTWATDFICTSDQIKLTRLKVLKHMIDPNQSQIINLQLKQFPLTTLRIRIRYRDVTLETLHELLCSLKHTLEDLQLIFMDYKCAKEFPSSQQLYRLKRFELWKYRGRLNFLKDFVALEELLIGEMDLKDQELFTERSIFKVLLPKVKKITFKDYWETKLFS